MEGESGLWLTGVLEASGRRLGAPFRVGRRDGYTAQMETGNCAARVQSSPWQQLLIKEHLEWVFPGNMALAIPDVADPRESYQLD